MRFTYYALASICILLAGCRLQNWGAIDLGHGYQLNDEANNTYLIGDTVIPANIISYGYNSHFILLTQCPQKESYVSFLRSNLSSDFRIYEERMCDTGKLISVKYAKTVNLDSNIHKMLVHYNISDTNDKDYERMDRLTDSLINNDPYFVKVFRLKLNYWIISCDDYRVHGPLSEQDFIDKKMELKVPDNIRMEMVE